MKTQIKTLALLMASGVFANGLVHQAHAADKFIVVQSTTSTENSGLFGHLLPAFKADTGIDVRVVAVGTGQALKNAQNCDGDVVLVHAKSAEEKFVAEGYGVKRTDVMYNDFVVVGPSNDPAGVAGSKEVVKSMKAIADKQALFASRGDDSGTHKKEQELWKEAKVDVKAVSGKWYRETGSGMGATLNTGVGMGAYVLADRASWIAFGNKGNFKIAVEGDPTLFNQYGVIAVNPAKCPNVKSDLGNTFVSWILSPKGQATIAGFKQNGQSLFFPNAPK
ncbi:tungstate transport system substrate-binding protein [Limnobacter thiooxidans]|uniref:Extracellular solute-binding protein n=1 Tax=Limnobacter thiooxidans TaxID=131080 RepID=A0AA86M896_9BURK|nr:substrate-binding domain-containing protein [Limnobacter sp.]MCZ8017074.1 substrate-binding domain-containing protein [Limnobacter sp.]RZS37275.1 tungstate transport system substrate-binding protein [Limnobacter thiooxidans]BET25469.1 extracellular solute-binding protein [Limnobacter thiooxidans]